MKYLNLTIIILYILLIFKDPFSQRTLIPNFEPYPDTFNYINPILNLIKGEGFNMKRVEVVMPNVPPLYSLSLIPPFLIRLDPRMSYFTNVILALASLSLFWLILKKIITNKLILFCLLILYVTNYFIYWVPSIVMAENLILTLFLAVVFYILSRPTIVSAIFTGFLIIAVYATKYANIPLSLAIFFSYSYKIISNQPSYRKKMLAAFLASSALFYILLIVFQAITKNNHLLPQILFFVDIIFSNAVQQGASLSEKATSGPASPWFDIGYLKQNLPFYINTLLGANTKFLWDNTPIVPSFVGILGSIGIVWSIFIKKYRFFAITLVAFILSLVFFMSTFYTHDARYIYIAIPTLLIGFGLFLVNLENQFFSQKKILLNVVIFISILIYLFSNFTRIKSQIGLNLRHAETPWNYIAVLKMNEYFTQEITGSKKPILISALPPYFIDYYSNGNYRLLPLSDDQEYRGQRAREMIWGLDDYSDLPRLYAKYLQEGYDLYVSRAGLGNEEHTNRAFDAVIQGFDAELVLSGCYDQCNIYSVKLKE